MPTVQLGLHHVDNSVMTSIITLSVYMCCCTKVTLDMPPDRVNHIPVEDLLKITEELFELI